MTTRVLFVDHDAEALGRIQYSLEQAGNYEAAVFTTGEAALEYAAKSPLSVAVIGLALRGTDPARLIADLRLLQPDLPIVLHAESHADDARVQALRPQAVLRGAYVTRALVALLNQALSTGEAAAPEAAPPPDTDAALAAEPPSELEDTREVPATDSPAVRQYLATSHADEDVAAFGEILEALSEDAQTGSAEDDTFDALVRSLGAPLARPPLPERHRRSMAELVRPTHGADEAQDETQPRPQAGPDETFERLAEEEPPLPTLEDSGTIRDLIAITDPDFIETPTPEPKQVPDDLIGSFAGLDWADDEDDATNTVTAMLQAVEKPGAPGDDLELEDAQRELLEALFAASGSAFEAALPEDFRLDRSGDSKLVPMPEEVRRRLKGQGDAAHLVSQNASGEDALAATPPPAPAPAMPSSAPPPAASAGPIDIATLALRLTHRTVESSAQATMLIQYGQVVASAGALPRGDIERLAAMVDTEAALAGSRLQIKFASLPHTNLNYLIVARPTVDGMVLAMVFTENVSLSAIRRQAKATVEALIAPPEIPPEERPETPSAAPTEAAQVVAAESEARVAGLSSAPEPEGVDAAPALAEAEDIVEARLEAREALESAPATLARYACAWILRDPDQTFDETLLQALPGWVDEIIAGQHWLADEITVKPDCVSAVISVPPADTPAQVVHLLMDETAQRILEAQPGLAPDAESLWADAYYILAPGRPLTSKEIEDFIRFQREE